jgi:DNA polymerase-1
MGPAAPFENGPRVFIDNFGECKDLILLFKDYFQDPQYKKVFFNYSFDYHMLLNHSIKTQGLVADVMHQARLLDPSKNPQ